MPDNSTTALVKTAHSPALARVSNQLALTDKLLTKPEEPFLIPYRKGNKWGFCDRNKNIVIDCVYDYVSPYSQGLAGVNSNRLGGLINSIGEFVILPIYDGVGNFNNGLAVAGFNNKRGYINIDGQVVIPFEYQNDIIVIEEDFSENLVSVAKDYKCGFLDKNGREVISLKYKSASKFSEGLSAVSGGAGHNSVNNTYSWKNNKYGYINKNDITIIPFDYDYVYDFSNGMAVVKLDRKMGLIDQENNIFLDFVYDKLSEFSNGLASAEIGYKKGVINQEGKFIIELDKEISLSGFSEGLVLAYSTKTGKGGYLNEKGDVIIPLIYKHVTYFKNSIALVAKENIKYGKYYYFYIDKNGVEYWED